MLDAPLDDGWLDALGNDFVLIACGKAPCPASPRTVKVDAGSAPAWRLAL